MRHGLIALLIICATQSALAQKNSQGGFLDFNIYPYLSDVDSDNVITLNIASKLANRFSYFSLTNFANQTGKTELANTTGFYSEQNIRWQVEENSSLDLTIQLNMRSGEDNDRQRLGFRWRLNDSSLFKDIFNTINLSYSINFHLLQFDNQDADIWQMEHVYRMTFPYISERLYLAGFIDHTFNEDLSDDYPQSPIVTESQLGFRLLENLYLIGEYRINQYRQSDINNFAAGVEYVIRW